MRQSLFLLLPLIFLASCYEDRVACLDPDASNYDLRADEACADDCCRYPNLQLNVTRVWGEESFSVDSIYSDGANNRFRLVRLRFYLGGLELASNEVLLPTPDRLIEIGTIENGDTVTTELNANVALIGTTTGTSTTIGTYRGENRLITGLVGTLGLGPEFAALVPSTAPASSPLLTQPGLLNLRDGLGYLQASAEYQLIGRADTARVNVYGFEPFALTLPIPGTPARGTTLTLLLEIDYRQAFAGVDLLARPEDFVTGLLRGMSLLEVQ